MKAIEIKDLKFNYDDIDATKSNDYALNGVNLSIEEGEFVTILGHNGSGKSTLSKLIVGLLKANSGTIEIFGEKLTEETVYKIRPHVGIVFQNPDNQFVGYNVKYDIAFGLENHLVERNEMIRLIDEYTKKVGMENELDREPQTLSGGQKQRVAIAGILALNCDIIILDEATSMLDPEGVEDITNLIVELKEKYNKTIICITHDLALANKSDRLIVLKEGSIIKEGIPSEVFKERELLQSSNLDMPFSLRFYNECKGVEVLEKDSKLMEALWEYHLKK